jgi:hypothetical protein
VTLGRRGVINRAACQIGRNITINRDNIDIHGQPFDRWQLSPEGEPPCDDVAGRTH